MKKAVPPRPPRLLLTKREEQSTLKVVDLRLEEKITLSSGAACSDLFCILFCIKFQRLKQLVILIKITVSFITRQSRNKRIAAGLIQLVSVFIC
jgi:hypothetical protein